MECLEKIDDDAVTLDFVWVTKSCWSSKASLTALHSVDGVVEESTRDNLSTRDEGGLNSFI